MSERDKVAATVERLRIVLAQLQTPSTSSFSISQNDIKRGEDLLWQYELQREHVEARVVNQRGIVALLKSLAHVSHDQPNQLLTQACSDAVAFLEAREQYLSTIANGYDEESPPWPLLCKQLEQRVRHLEKRNQEWEISCKRLTTQAHDSETRSQRAFAEISRLVGMMYDDQWFSESCVLLQLLLLVEMTHPKAITVVAPEPVSYQRLTEQELDRLRASTNAFTKDFDTESICSSIPGPFNRLASLWMPNEMSEECLLCNKKFSMVNRRRHHCRNCGRLVCGDCSGAKTIIPGLPKGLHRVCDRCLQDDPELRKSAKNIPDRLKNLS
eukprot:c5580_g1_i2.p1 GENE.c5580_g1_i2~~c5580_g1_i2.p1  ORF type:complete len:340 (-),score=28.19 c5580_g1_i2:94-1074(-)